MSPAAPFQVTPGQLTTIAECPFGPLLQVTVDPGTKATWFFFTTYAPADEAEGKYSGGFLQFLSYKRAAVAGPQTLDACTTINWGMIDGDPAKPSGDFEIQVPDGKGAQQTFAVVGAWRGNPPGIVASPPGMDIGRPGEPFGKVYVKA